ncbi:hypothetical protein HanIR_Chr09g0426181 [Helianthus annuus]|nr:hypothetical protein HanIR_Chr09g0426181 [Helianthus annuus]
MKHFFWLSFVLRSECDYILIIVIMEVTEKWYDDQINNSIIKRVMMVMLITR